MQQTSDQEMQKDFEASGSIYPKVEASHIEEMMNRVKYDTHIVPDTTTTVITAYIPMGAVNFTVATEIMACVDPRNFNAEKGAKYGIEKAAASAKNKLWELEGYRLAHQLAEKGKEVDLTHVERMQLEARGLDTKIVALDKFIKSNPIFGTIDQKEQDLMKRQLSSMISYAQVLGDRLDSVFGAAK